MVKFKIVLFIREIIRKKNKSINKPCQSIKVPYWAKVFVFIRDDGCIITKWHYLIKHIIRINEAQKLDLFYANLDKWCVKDAYIERYERQVKFIKEKFIKYIKKDDIMCDIGCASGDFTFEFAKYCKHIDGYDLSQKMVNTAKNYAKEHKINNAVFYQGICEDIQFNKMYDNISFMGVLSYIMDDNAAKKAIKNVYNTLKAGGYVIYKDNSNETNHNCYFFGPAKDYTMIARSRNNIKNMFKECGFRVVEEDFLHKLQHISKNNRSTIKTTSVGMIFQKI